MLIFLVFQIGILYAFDSSKPFLSMKKRFEILSVIFIVCTAVLSLLSFFFMLFGYAKIVPKTEGPTICYGFVWGRLFGAYWDPNIGSVFAILAIIFSVLILLKKIRHTGIWLISNCILQGLYVVFSDSRTGRSALLLTCSIMAFLFSVRYLKITSLKKKAAAIAGIVLLSVVVGIVTPTVCKKAANYALTGVYRIRVAFTEDNAKVSAYKQIQIVRPDGIPDLTNRRKYIWKSAVEIWEKEPVFGVSRYGILPYA
jgi:hypothetical protein